MAFGGLSPMPYAKANRYSGCLVIDTYQLGMILMAEKKRKKNIFAHLVRKNIKLLIF